MELQASGNMPSKDESNVVRCAGNVVGEKDFASFRLLRRKRGEPRGGLSINFADPLGTPQWGLSHVADDSILSAALLV